MADDAEDIALMGGIEIILAELGSRETVVASPVLSKDLLEPAKSDKSEEATTAGKV